MDPEDAETCWICLEGLEAADCANKSGPLQSNRLFQPCKCPRAVHSICLAKWQLSQSGKSEEKFCRFCKDRLPDWQENLALPGMAAVEPVMSVHFNGQTHMVKVKPGEEGRVAFIQDVRRLLRLRDNQEFSITFECKVPGHGMFLDLKGLSSYDAAVFCAAMTAVERQRLAAAKAHKVAAAAAAAAASTNNCSSAGPSCSIASSAPTAAAAAAGPSSLTVPSAATAAATPASACATGTSTAATACGAAAGAALRASTAGSVSAASDADIDQTSRVPSSSSGGGSIANDACPTTNGGAMSPESLTRSHAGPSTSASPAAAVPASARRAAVADTASPLLPATASGRSSAGTGRSSRWRSADSACDVQPAGAAGASAATGVGSAAASAAATAADRRKMARQARQAPGAAPAAAPASLMSRLFMCVGFGGSAHPEASH